MQSSFIRNVSILVSGTIIAQVFAVLASPILSRLYLPEQFGEYAIFITIVGLLSTISSLSYEMAIVKQKEEFDANSLFKICLCISLIASILVLLLIFILQLNTHIPFALIIPFGIFLYAINNAMYSLLNRYEMYSQLSKIQALRSAIIVTLQILCGYIGYTHYGLVLGALVSAIIVFVFSLYKFSESHEMETLISLKKIKLLLITNSDFPKYGVAQNFVSYISANSPILVLTIYFDLAIVGAYFFAVKLVQIPANVLGAAVKRVFFRKAEVLKYDLNSLIKLYDKMVLAMTAIIFPIVILWFFYAESIFPLVFGEEWINAAILSKWLLIWFGAQFVMAPTRSLFIVYDIQKQLLIFDFLLGLFRLSLLFFLAQTYSATDMIMNYSVFSAIVCICFVIYIHYYLVRLRKSA